MVILWRGGSLLHRLVKQAEELSERCLVHDVDHGHLSDEEIQYGAPGSHWAVLLSCRVDLYLGLCGHIQLVVDFQGCLFGDFEDINEGLIVNQGTLPGRIGIIESNRCPPLTFVEVRR